MAMLLELLLEEAAAHECSLTPVDHDHLLSRFGRCQLGFLFKELLRKPHGLKQGLLTKLEWTTKGGTIMEA